MISKSPNNIRRINFEIAEGMLRALRENKNGLEYQDLSSEGFDIAIRQNSEIENRTTKGNEEIMELRRLGLIELIKIGKSNVHLLSPEGEEFLTNISEEERENLFFQVLYEKEPLFQKLIDMLQRRRKIYAEEMFELSGTNSVKISFLKNILKQLPSIVRLGSDGRKSYIEYIKREVLTVSELRKIIIKTYRSLRGTKLFVSIDDLWNSVLQNSPNISEELFDNILIDLTEEYLGKVELSQGISSPGSKILHDKRSGTYFHYLKIPEQVLEVELENGSN